MVTEKRWILLFLCIICIWFIIISSTLYQYLNGIEALVDRDINLFYLTLPLLGINLTFNLLSLFIFCCYLIVYNRIAEYQRKKSQSKRNLNGENRSKEVVRYSGSNKNINNPLCSIIIPSNNEEKVIRKTIQNCLSQSYKNIEVIIVCHNCNDRTFEEAQIKDSRVKPFNLETKEVGKGIPLNYGIGKSNGDYILVFDSDGKLSNDFIEKALPLFEDNIAAIQGKYIPSNRNYNFITRLLSIEGDLWSTPYMTVRSFLQKKVYLGGTGFIIKKDILYKVGGFANHLVDDYELSCRLFKQGYRSIFAPLSINYDEKPGSIEIMLRQRARWAKGFISLLKTTVVKPTDIIGFLYWLSPIAIMAGFAILIIFGYAAIHNLLFEYYPYTYSYISLTIWFLLVGMTFLLQSAILIKEYGYNGLKYAIYLVVYLPFSLYVFVSFIKGLFVKSWVDTKTIHGFIKEKEMSNSFKE